MDSMEKEMYQRTRSLIGDAAMARLRKARVAVFGLGGVGGFCVEALARAGVGSLILVDFDKVDITNLNRQIIALQSTVGMEKTRLFRERIGDIDPDTEVKIHTLKATPENIGSFELEHCDYVVDAVDDVAAKAAIAEEAVRAGVPVISSMGTGNKLDPQRFRIADLEETHTCPLARRVRRELRLKGIRGGVRALFSVETPVRETRPPAGGSSPASISFVPSAAGLLIAAEVVRALTAGGTSGRGMEGGRQDS